MVASISLSRLAPILAFWVPGVILLCCGRIWIGLALIAAPVALGGIILLYFLLSYLREERMKRRARPKERGG